MRIVAALKQAKLISDKPEFINIRTVIGVGTLVAGTAKAHHGLFDTASIEASKRLIGINPRSTHTVLETILEYFCECKIHGKILQREWNQMLVKYREAFPHEAEQVLCRMTGELDKIVSQQLATLNSVDIRVLATREINTIVLERLGEWCPAMIGGGADLVNSNKVTCHESDVVGPATSFQGRFIRYGIRDHAMSEGQDGPTHQPVELGSLLRTMPNLTYIFPSDVEEVIGAWQYSLANSHGSSMISFARDPTVPIPNTDRNKVSKGCYVIQEDENPCVTLASCGSNLHYAVAAA
ncbi:hypothetical protein ZTR_09110 [Talaromyces verruculosus]|nr:hypothetical protein ZTR_09110 [Talaromyces verruculosus]